MNWAGCLGVGRDGLLIAERPTRQVDWSQAPATGAECGGEPEGQATPKRTRVKRSRAESAALRGRVTAALQRIRETLAENAKDGGTRPVESHADIALREGIHVSYVCYIAQLSRMTKAYRSHDAVTEIARQARALMGRADNPLNQKQAAAALGVSPQYLCMLLARFIPTKATA